MTCVAGHLVQTTSEEERDASNVYATCPCLTLTAYWPTADLKSDVLRLCVCELIELDSCLVGPRRHPEQ